MQDCDLWMFVLVLSHSYFRYIAMFGAGWFEYVESYIASMLEDFWRFMCKSWFVVWQQWDMVHASCLAIQQLMRGDHAKVAQIFRLAEKYGLRYLSSSSKRKQDDSIHHKTANDPNDILLWFHWLTYVLLTSCVFAKWIPGIIYVLIATINSWRTNHDRFVSGYQAKN